MSFSVEQVFSVPEYHSLKNDGACGFASENANDVPTITCPGNITVSNLADSCGAVVTYSVTATAPVYSSSTIPGYSYVTSSGDRYYFLSDATSNYSSARSAATSLGGYLVCINSATENALFSSVSSNFWTGGTRTPPSIVWGWADGTDFSSYSNWRAGEPNNEGDETCMEYLADYDEWNDLNEDEILKYLVEMTLSIRQIAGLASGSFFPVGTTTNTFVVTDYWGHTDTCSFTVTVTDDEYPSVITSPAYREITMSCDTDVITYPAFSTANAPSSYAVFSSYPNNGVAIDNCGIDSVYYHDVITGFYKKTVTRTWTLTDAKGNSVSCTQTILLNPPCNGVTFTDIDGNSYDEVLVGTSCWMKQNLKTRHYANGTVVPIAKAYYAADYPDTISNVNTFGRLYSWYSAVNVPENSTTVPTEVDGQVQGVCPTGWYMPKDEHFSEILTYGGASLKSSTLWLNGLNGTNSTGFTGLPAGYYDAAANEFLFLYGNSGFWSATYTTSVKGPCCSLDFNCPDLLFANYIKGNGNSVRCVKACPGLIW